MFRCFKTFFMGPVQLQTRVENGSPAVIRDGLTNGRFPGLVGERTRRAWDQPSLRPRPAPNSRERSRETNPRSRSNNSRGVVREGFPQRGFFDPSAAHPAATGGPSCGRSGTVHLIDLPSGRKGEFSPKGRLRRNLRQFHIRQTVRLWRCGSGKAPSGFGAQDVFSKRLEKKNRTVFPDSAVLRWSKWNHLFRESSR